MPRIWGKVIGGLLGLTLGGGPLGAVLGMLAGHAYDTRLEMGGDPLGAMGFAPSAFAGTVQQASFTMGVVVLGAKMAKIDGRVTRAEIDAFKRAFQIEPAQEESIGKLFDRARRSADGFEPYAFQLAQTFRNQPVVLEQVLNGLFIIAASDSVGISPIEARFLKQVAYIFNFGPEDFRRIAARAGVQLPDDETVRASERSTASEPFAILGLGERASNEEIKAAYRVLIRKHHPDRLVADGMPPEFIASANEQMKRINAAYDTVCKMRGIK
jgi:DnaJ like chaperone protein